MLTLFAAIRPTQAILDQITEIQTSLDGINWIKRDNLHITVGYFGQISAEQAENLDREIAKSTGYAFEVRLNSLGTFGKERVHTIWAGIEKNLALEALHQHIRRAAKHANVKMEARKYTPHLSLAYPRGYTDKIALARYIHRFAGFRSSPFLVDEFALYSSHHNKSGPNTYRKEANYPLLG